MEHTEIVKINPAEFGLTDETAKNIQSQFEPMLAKMVELEEEFNKIVQLPVDDKETTKKAKELRLKYVKVRTGTADIHKTQKAFYLNGGRFVDGWKNAQLFASEGKEKKLQEIEDYFQNLELEKTQKILEERSELIRPYVDDPRTLGLSNMSEDVFQAYLSTKKTQHEERLAAELKAEQDRIQREKEEAEERERIRKENEQLKKEAEEKATLRSKRDQELKPYIIFIRDYNLMLDLIEEDYQKELSEIKIGAEQHWKEEKEKADAEQKRQEEERKSREEENRKLAEAKEELRKIQERSAKEQDEQKKKEEAERKEKEKLAKAPVKKQLNTWVDTFSLPDIHLTSEKKDEIILKFEAFKKWAKSEIESM